ncbi:aromatase/cyclase [Amycolatopsis solani]|uniref:aromatase/cyclase n=1 Tax=Amycolatopsis solani TaxID=3028615 RepID=UPI0025B15D96|nr:SRPBCC family protein [Amycolatopsis sp. MEP2-6]
MTSPELHTRHETIVEADAPAVYDLITDVVSWPVIFGPTVHTRVLERSPQGDRFEIRALMPDGVVRAWRSHREFDAARRVTFAQDHDDPAFGRMAGGWTFVPLPGERTKVVLEHDFTPPSDHDRDAVLARLDHNSTAELAALRAVAVLPGGVGRWLLTFTESLALAGPVSAAREFVWAADRWPERLPHVDGLDLTGLGADTQSLIMRTRAADGSVHTTRSLRVLLPGGSIAYKQNQPPRGLLGHCGRWDFPADGTSIRSTHTFLVDPAAAGAPEAALNRFRAALAANSRTTMEHAARFAAAIGAVR